MQAGVCPGVCTALALQVADGKLFAIAQTSGQTGEPSVANSGPALNRAPNTFCTPVMSLPMPVRPPSFALQVGGG
jgi:hypothetical protein